MAFTRPDPRSAAPIPLRTAPAIPVDAAGRQPLFFFGTLMDRDVLARILGHARHDATLRPARLDGFRREAGHAVPYPLLVPASGGTVAGLLLTDASARDIARINHYESGEYRAELHVVYDTAGTSHDAWLYMAFAEVIHGTGDPWDLATWQDLHKDLLLELCDGWMEDCPVD